MATDAIVLLERLSCIALTNTEGRTEPYIWPALIRIDDNTIATPERVAMQTPPLVYARRVIKDSMRAGETADIPPWIGVQRTRFEDNLMARGLILVVALLESDETPLAAMQAGFNAFYREIRTVIAENLLALSTANEDQLALLIDGIKQSVEQRVRSAIENGLTAYEKAKYIAGFLDLDDSIGSDFKSFRSDALSASEFILHFETRGRDWLGHDTLSQYEIQGQLRMQPVVADRCQVQVNAVNAAQSVVNGIEAQIQKLQEQLHGEGEEPAPPKNIIIAEIVRIRAEELAPAVAALEEARAALQACRDLPFTHSSQTVEVVVRS